MLNKNFVNSLKKQYDTRELERREIISLSNNILHGSKRAIFCLHRGDLKKAESMFLNIEKTLKKLEKKFGFRRVYEEGSYRAAAEEYVEAKMLYLVVTDGQIDAFKNILINHESYLGGMCDLTGELVRRATNEASLGKYQEVDKISRIINGIMSELVKFDMTGYLRTKYDQAKGSLRKIEQINYDINIRK